MQLQSIVFLRCITIIQTPGLLNFLLMTRKMCGELNSPWNLSFIIYSGLAIAYDCTLTFDVKYGKTSVQDLRGPREKERQYHFFDVLLTTECSFTFYQLFMSHWSFIYYLTYSEFLTVASKIFIVFESVWLY